MQGKPFHLEVFNIDHPVFSGDVLSIQVTADRGEMGVFAGHLPLLAALQPGILHINKPDHGSEVLYLSGGFMEVQRHRTLILSDQVVRGTELDAAEANSARIAAEKALLSQSDAQEESLESAQELAKALAKLRAIRLSRYPTRPRPPLASTQALHTSNPLSS